MQAELFTASLLLPDIIKQNEGPKVTSATIIRTRETWELFCGLTIRPTFRNATTHSVFPAKCRLKKERRNFILVTCHHPGLESASYWLKQLPSRDDRPQVLLRPGEWKVISMEFLRSFLRRHIAGKLVTEWWRREISTISQATIFHPRIKPVLQQISLLQVAGNYCTTATKFVYNVLCTDPRKWGHSSCKTDLSSVCFYSNLKKGITIYQKIENKMKIYSYI